MSDTSISGLKSTIMQRISDTVDKVQDVADYDKTTFRGFPAVCVICSRNQNSYISTAQNERVFGFAIRVYEQIENVPEPDALSDSAKQRAEKIMERVVSQIIDAFDKFYEFNGAADFCRAIPSIWGYAKLDCGWCRVAEINLEVVQNYTVV